MTIASCEVSECCSQQQQNVTQLMAGLQFAKCSLERLSVSPAAKYHVKCHQTLLYCQKHSLNQDKQYIQLRVQLREVMDKAKAKIHLTSQKMNCKKKKSCSGW